MAAWVITTMAAALRPGGQLMIGMHRGDGDHPRTSCYGDVPIAWTTHRYQPEQIVELLIAAALDLVVDQRFPPRPPSTAPTFVVVGVKPSG
jgi:hypothetical protein